MSILNLKNKLRDVISPDNFFSPVKKLFSNRRQQLNK